MPSQALEECRICKSRDIKFLRELESLINKELIKYFYCENCKTILDEKGIPPSYKVIEENVKFNNIDFIRFYTEIGAGLDMPAAILSCAKTIFKNRKTQIKHLDIGAGFGFTVALAESLGWDTIGLEPSKMGEAGKEILGVPIKFSYLEEAKIEKNSLDFITSSEVIEHVKDPKEFLVSIYNHLKPDGIMAITTPNSEPLIGDPPEENEWLEAMNAGYHLNILSQKSLELLLKDSGFKSMKFFFDGGTSGKKHIILFASPSPLITFDNLNYKREFENGNNILENFYKKTIKERRKNTDDIIYPGIVFRLFELLVNQGRYQEAEKEMQKLDRIIDKKGIKQEKLLNLEASNFSEYMSKVPAFMGKYLFFKGMYYLNGTDDSNSAVKYFEIAKHLFSLEEKVGYFSSACWKERAELHVGIALLKSQRRHKSIEIFNKLLSQKDTLPEDIRESALWHKGVAHLQLNENVPALSAFSTLFLNKNPHLGEDEKRYIQHFILTISQFFMTLQQPTNSVFPKIEEISLNIKKIEERLYSIEKYLKELK